MPTLNCVLHNTKSNLHRCFDDRLEWKEDAKGQFKTIRNLKPTDNDEQNSKQCGKTLQFTAKLIKYLPKGVHLMGNKLCALTNTLTQVSFE